MPRTTALLVRDTLLALVVGVAAAFALPAWGQPVPEVGYIPPEAPPLPQDLQGAVAQLISGADPLVAFFASGFLSSVIIIAALMWLRKAFASKFDPPGGATEASRLWNMGVAMALGLLLGISTIAPAIPIPGRELVGWTLITARLFGGFLCATAALFGRDFYKRGSGALEERREAKAAVATMTTGEFRALRDEKEQP